MKDNMLKNVFAHLMAPMALLFLVAGLVMFWTTVPTQVTTPMVASQESWFLPWTWSMDESFAMASASAAGMANQAMVVDATHHQYVGLVLGTVGACGVAAITIAGLKSSKTAPATVAVTSSDVAPATVAVTSSDVTATKKRRSSKTPAQIPPGVEHPGARRKTAVTA